jgi:hypothetical protein
MFVYLSISDFPISRIASDSDNKKTSKGKPALLVFDVFKTEFVQFRGQSLLLLLVHGAPLVRGHEAFVY